MITRFRSRDASTMLIEKSTVVTSRVFASPKAAISTPAVIGPTNVATPCRVWVSPIARVIGTSSSAAAAGTVLLLAICPGPSKKTPSTWVTATIQSEKESNHRVTARASAVIRLRLSARMETRRPPIRSVTNPPVSVPSSAAMPITKAMVPALAALPVRVSTSHGTTRAITWLAYVDADWADSTVSSCRA